MSKKKILFFVCSMEGGGAERVASLLCNHWVKKGYDVTLVPVFSGRGTCIYSLDAGVRLVYLADLVGTTKKNFLTRIRRLLAMRQLIRKTAPDVVLSFLTHVNRATLLAACGLRVPVVISERIYPPAMINKKWTLLLLKLLYPCATAVVMQTRQGHTWLEEYIKKARGHTIANPLFYPLPAGTQKNSHSAAVLQTLTQQQKKSLLLTVGRLDCQKGFDRLLAVFSRISPHFPDWHLVIAGEGEERGNLEALVLQYNLTGAVSLPGSVGNIARWYENSELFVMTSRFEGFPNVLLEAMAHGLPAVSVDCLTGPRDIIRHTTDGLLVPPDDGEALETALVSLMRDEKTRQEYSQRAVEVRQRFHMEKIAAQWDAVLFGEAASSQQGPVSS